MDTCQVDTLTNAFRDQLLACLEECIQGRRGMFSSDAQFGGEPDWPEAARLRALAEALPAILAGFSQPAPLIDEFLDLCTVNVEDRQGEQRMARAFLRRIERGEVGTPTQQPARW